MEKASLCQELQHHSEQKETSSQKLCNFKALGLYLSTLVVATQDGYTVRVSNFQRHQKLPHPNTKSKVLPILHHSCRITQPIPPIYPKLTWFTNQSSTKQISAVRWFVDRSFCRFYLLPITVVFSWWHLVFRRLAFSSWQSLACLGQVLVWSFRVWTPFEEKVWGERWNCWKGSQL